MAFSIYLGYLLLLPLLLLSSHYKHIFKKYASNLLLYPSKKNLNTLCQLFWAGWPAKTLPFLAASPGRRGGAGSSNPTGANVVVTATGGPSGGAATTSFVITPKSPPPPPRQNTQKTATAAASSDNAVATTSAAAAASLAGGHSQGGHSSSSSAAKDRVVFMYSDKMIQGRSHQVKYKPCPQKKRANTINSLHKNYLTKNIYKQQSKYQIIW